MTAREISMFDEMFNVIFNAVAEQKNAQPDQQQELRDPLSDFRVDSLLTSSTTSTAFLGKLRRRSFSRIYPKALTSSGLTTTRRGKRDFLMAEPLF
jgi:hypothetical protein